MILYGSLLCVLFSTVFLPKLPAHQAASPPRLLSIAKQVVKLPKLKEYGYYYQWQTEQDVLVWKDDPNDFKPGLIDVRSGARDDLKAFNARLVQMWPRGGHHIWLHTLRLSPDGKWVIWMEGGIVSPPTRWGALSLDGSRFVSGDIGYYFGQPILLWLPDSRHFAALSDDPQALLIYSLDAPTRQHQIELPPFPSEWMPKVNFYLILIGFPSPGRALARIGGTDEEGVPNTGFYTFPIMERTGARHYIIPIPNGVQTNGLDALELSPQGNRLAWCYRFFREWDKGLSNRQEVWVSDVDGSHMHEVGFHESLYANPADRPVRALKTPSFGPSDNRPADGKARMLVEILSFRTGSEMTEIYGQPATSHILDSFQWLSDGKRLSFLYDDAIWIVPVD